MALDHSADDSGLSRRDFLERTAYAGGGRRARPGCPPTRSWPRPPRRPSFQAAAEAAQRADRPLRPPDDGEPVVRPLLRLASAATRTATRTSAYPNPEGELVRTRATPRRSARGGVRVEGLRPSRSRPRVDLGPRSAERRLPRPGQRQRRVRALLLQPRRPRLHSRGGAELHALRPVLLLDPRGHLAEPVLQVVRAVGRAEDQHARARRKQLGDDLRPRARGRADREATTTRTCPSGCCSAARATKWLAPITQYYEDAAAGTLPNIAIVDPAYGDGGGSDGLSADEHPLGDVRLGQAFQADVVERLHPLPQLPPRRALPDLRRVGRLLRPCPATARAGRPGERHTERGLRPARLPRAGRGSLAVHPQSRRDAEGALRRLVVQADLARRARHAMRTSRSSASSATASGSGS